MLGEDIGGGDVDGGSREILKGLVWSHWEDNGLTQSKTESCDGLLSKGVK